MNEETKEQKTARLKIYNEGISARRAGKFPLDNPYSKTDWAYGNGSHWWNGWQAGAKP